MFRLIALAAFAVAITTSAQAMTVAPVHQPEGMITQVAWACGPGMTRINGVCVAEPLFAMPAGARDGVEALACATTKTRFNRPGKSTAPCRSSVNEDRVLQRFQYRGAQAP